MLDIDELIQQLGCSEHWNREPPIQAAEVSRLNHEIEQCVGHPLSRDYLVLLGYSDGGQFWTEGVGIVLWSSENLIEYNESYQIRRWLPHGLIIGTDGGDYAYVFDFRVDEVLVETPLYRISFGSCLPLGFEDEEAELLATSLAEWVKSWLSDAPTQ